MREKVEPKKDTREKRKNMLLTESERERKGKKLSEKLRVSGCVSLHVCVYVFELRANPSHFKPICRVVGLTKKECHK